MKNHSFILKIEKPCSENVSAMPRHDVGLYCSHCEKNVIDFSKLSDDEVIRIVEKLDGKVCGRLTKKQLERIFVATQNKKVSPRLNTILAGLFALGMLESQDSSAKEVAKTQVVLQHNFLDENNVAEQKMFEQIKPADDSTKNIIRGKVVENGTNSPVRFISVTIKNSTISTTTDTAGNFKIHVPDNLMSDTITLQVYSIGYEMKETKIAKSKLSDKLTIGVAQEQMIMGDMIYTPPPKNKTPKKK